ncbi:hypothetical protein U1769_01135 [Sphingomonas sp. ZT3P38]|uniref:hypothetical protein n=1 Tax=Parasphingomonas zepuensis TaxID=3096161 RepID=UPI002FC92ACE
MRFAMALVLILAIGGAADARQTRAMRHLPPVYDVADRLMRHPPLLTASRLPEHYKLGRCRLDVRGHTYIAGPCAYSISRGGALEFHGPHQVFGGVDYRRPGIFAEEISTDFFVQVDHELLDNGAIGSGWEAHWNENKRATHAQSQLGKVTKHGACYVNNETRICLWKR